MRTIKSFSAVYLCRAPVDFRKSIDGLIGIVTAEMKLDPYQPAVFAFVNRHCDRVRLLYWDRTGFAMWYLCRRRHKYHYAARPVMPFQTCKHLLSAAFSTTLSIQQAA